MRRDIKTFFSLFVLITIFSGCQITTSADPVLPMRLPPTALIGKTPSATDQPNKTIQSTVLPSPTTEHFPTNTSSSMITHTANATPMAAPAIHDKPVEMYESLFTVPVSPDTVFQYEKGHGYTYGPGAIAALPNGELLILDNVGYRQLIRFDITGRLLDTIELYGLDKALNHIIDVQVYMDEIYILETGYEIKQIRRFSMDGESLSSYNFPHEFPLINGRVVEGAISGVTFDCDGSMLLEYFGNEIYSLSDVQNWPGSPAKPSGYKCNNQLFHIIPLFDIPRVAAGRRCFTTQLTNRIGGGLHLLKVFPDGSFYLEREDMIKSPPEGAFDRTVHYFGAEGTVKAIARVPQSEFFVNVSHKIAVADTGEIYTYLTHPNSIEVIRLNFYKSLEPLAPEAAIPQFSECGN